MNKPAVVVWPVVVYVAAQLIANISSLKIGMVFHYAVDMGVFLYPLTFTIRDVMHQAVGKAIAMQVVMLAAAANLCMSLYLWFIGLFPAITETEQSAFFDVVMSPIWRLVVFSIIAQIISELIDTHIYHKYVQKFGAKHKWGRVLCSNTISIPIDNIIFCVGAFAITMEWSIVWQIFTFNLVVKYAMSLLSIPMIYIQKKEAKD